MTQSSCGPRRFRSGKRTPLISALLALGLLLNLVVVQFASAAGADNLASALDVSGSLPVLSDATVTTSATNESGELGSCGGFPASGNTHSVWYRYTATTGWLTLNTFGSDYDTVLEVFSGPASPTYATLASVVCNDDAASGTRQSEITIPVTAGTNYYIVARTFGAGSGGNLNFSALFSTQRQVYVNQTNGSDGNTGSAALPFRTVGKAESVLPAAGGVIQIADPGVYNEAVTIGRPTTFQVPSGAVSIAGLTLTTNPVTAVGTFGAAAVDVRSGAKIQQAIDLAAAGGMVNVADSGTYTESLAINKNLTLQSSTGATLNSINTAISVSGGQVTITGLNIGGTTAGLANTGGTVTAASNWWGSATGPAASTNPGGSGSAISGAVNYRPWCTMPAPTCSGSGGVATQLVFTAQPSDSTPNAPFPTQPIVTAKDASGNLDTSYSGNVTLSIKSGTGIAGAALNGTVTVAAVNGVATFSGLSIDLINPVGSPYQLIASDGTLPNAQSAAFNIAAGVPAQLVFNPSPSSSTGGTPFLTQPVVEVQDAGGYVVTNYTGSITLKIAANPGSGTLAGTTTVAVSNGRASFSGLSIDKPGVGYTLQASVGALSGTSSAFNITVGAVAKLVFNPSPSDAQAGTAFPTQPIVEAHDAGGNVVTSFNGSISVLIANNPAGGTLSGTTTATAVNGVAAFSGLSIDKAGDGYTLQASDGSLAGTSAAFNITAGAPTLLVFTSLPADTRAGIVFTNQPVIEARDAFGNIARGFNGPVALTITSGTGAQGASLLPAMNTTVNAVNGVASFSGLSINTIGVGYRLTASIAGPLSVDSSSFNITATGLVFTLQPVNTPAGQTFVVTLAAQDAANNTDTTFNGPVTLAIKPGTGSPRATLGGTVTVNAVKGVADFSGQGLNIIKAATGYILIASTSGLAGTESQPFDITSGPVTKLAFATSPSNTPAGAALTLAVEARDAFDNLATNYTGTADLSIATNPGSGTLGGMVSKAVSAGLASFGAAEGLNIDRIGVGYTLHATSGGLTADSAAFNITASRLVFVAEPSNTSVGAAFATQPILRAEDGFGTLDTTFTGPVALSILGGSSGATLNGTTVLAASGGVVTFSRLAIDRIGTGYQLNAAATGLPGATSTAFDITKAVLYAPLMMTPGYPDLVARFSLSTTAIVEHTPVVITVTITNQGNAPADPFWVDFYINPTVPPTAANQPWDKSCGGRCEQGIAWYVDKTLAPGESVTLSSAPGSYYAKNTTWDGSFNTGLLNLYLYADSWNPGVKTGAVYESNESNNRAEFHLQAGLASAQVSAVTPPADLPALPPRPARPNPER